MNIELLIIPVVTMILAQILKLATDDKKDNLSVLNIFGHYGGMPSTHAAYLASIGTLIALYDNIDSTIFALWVVVTAIIIRDALGLRREVSRHSIAIIELAKKLNSPLPNLNIRVGHKPIEIIAGLLFGFSITIIIKLLILS